MGKINFGRVLLGGLVAGALITAGEYVLNDIVLASQMKDYFARHNFQMPGARAMAVVIVMTFVLGIVIVLGYAAIRPRFGAGPKTAVIAALFAWFGVYVYGNVIAAALGLVPTNMLAIALPWGFAEYLIATMAGAALYKES